MSIASRTVTAPNAPYTRTNEVGELHINAREGVITYQIDRVDRVTATGDEVARVLMARVEIAATMKIYLANGQLITDPEVSYTMWRNSATGLALEAGVLAVIDAAGAT